MEGPTKCEISIDDTLVIKREVLGDVVEVEDRDDVAGQEVVKEEHDEDENVR
jgi:hypothetical protein